MCDEFVDTYGKPGIDMIISDLEPHKVCVELGPICPANATIIAVQMRFQCQKKNLVKTFQKEKNAPNSTVRTRKDSNV